MPQWGMNIELQSLKTSLSVFETQESVVKCIYGGESCGLQTAMPRARIQSGHQSWRPSDSAFSSQRWETTSLRPSNSQRSEGLGFMFFSRYLLLIENYTACKLQPKLGKHLCIFCIQESLVAALRTTYRISCPSHAYLELLFFLPLSPSLPSPPHPLVLEINLTALHMLSTYSTTWRIHFLSKALNS